jgi:hypothetical protein
VSHSTCTHRGRVDSRLLVVRSQTASLTLDPSFIHNLCCRCPNDSCKVIFDIYASRPFQRYKKHLKVRCFDPYNRALSFWESRRTPKSPFRECECHPHTPSKWGCDKTNFNDVKRRISFTYPYYNIFLLIYEVWGDTNFLKCEYAIIHQIPLEMPLEMPLCHHSFGCVTISCIVQKPKYK